MAGHSQDPHLSLISRIYNDSLDATGIENRNIAEVVDGISNQLNEFQENGDNFLIGKWIIF